MSWLESLRNRWHATSTWQVILILLVFIFTGSTIVFIKRPLLGLLLGDQPMPFWGSILYYILILPVYNVFLLVYGFLFGQFSFFWNFEQRLINRLFGRKRKDSSQ